MAESHPEVIKMRYYVCITKKAAMETRSNRMISLVALYDYQTVFLFKALDGISDSDAQNRLNTKANHVAWLTGSLVQQRYELANAFNLGMKQAADDLFANFKGIQDGVTYPALDTFRKDWEDVSPLLREALLNAEDERLNAPFDMAGHQMKFYDLLLFSTYREANCIGQIALWRRLLGYEAMKYD
jgi:hypothetical protein